MTENTKKRKIIIPTKSMSQATLTTSTVIPSTDILLHDAKSILACELSKYRTKTSKGVTLDLKEARIVQGYLETLIKIQKEEREAARQEDLSNLTDAELLELAGKVLGSTKPLFIDKDK